MNNTKSKTYKERVNREIRARRVLCIDHENNNIGIIDIKDALALASENNLDLVQISYSRQDNVPACKILDYGKYKYDLSKKQKDISKKQRENKVKTKEVKFRPNTGINDLKVKAKKTISFLEQGHKVKVSVKFKGRELNLRGVGYSKLDEFLNLVSRYQFLTEPSQDGRALIALITQSNEVYSETA